MPKISSYHENVDERASAIIYIGSSNYRVTFANLLSTSLAVATAVGAYVYDFVNYFVNMPTDTMFPQPWTLTFIGAGAAISDPGTENHPGIMRVVQSGANTGAGFLLGNQAAFLIAGEEETELIFQLLTVSASAVVFGFGDNFAAVGVPSDGIVMVWNGTNITGRTYTGGVTSSTGTSFTPSANVWYRMKIVVNSNATRVDYYIYDESGNMLWTDNLTTNIPTAGGRELGHGFTCYKTTAGTVDIAWFDYITLFMPKILAR